MRLVLSPLVILSAAKFLPIAVELKQVLIVQAAMPAAMTPILLARLYGGRAGIAVQVVVATITSDADAYAMEVAAALRARGLRVETDVRNEKINYKVREHSMAKTPVIAVVGRREAEEGKVALRRLGSDGQEILTLVEAANLLAMQADPPDVARDARGVVEAG